MLEAESAAGEEGERVGDHLQVWVGLLSDGLSAHFLSDDVADIAEVGLETDGVASEVFTIIVWSPEMVGIEVESSDGILRERFLGLKELRSAMMRSLCIMTTKQLSFLWGVPGRRGNASFVFPTE